MYLRLRGSGGVHAPWAVGYLWIRVRVLGCEHVKVEECVYLCVWAPYVCACAYGEVGM